MAMYFETSVMYDKMMENGMVKKTTDKYLVDALSFAEAEERTIEEVTPYISGDFNVKTARKTKIAEIFNLEADKYYLVKVGFIQINESTGVEKRSITHILVGADTFEDALQIFKDGMKNTMSDYEVVSIAETPILEIFPAKVG